MFYMKSNFTADLKGFNQQKLNGAEAQLAHQLMTTSFEHEYYKSYADDCFDPFMKEDLLNKIDKLSQNYIYTRKELENLNPAALHSFEECLTLQKAMYFSPQWLN